MKNLNKSIFLILVSIILIVFNYSCKKTDEKPVVESGTMTDIDNNIYNTVKIGNKWWMAENLKVKRYRNGDSIIFVNELGFYLDSAKWNNIDSGAYCIIDNSSSASQNYKGKLFGFLYNFYAVKDIRNIAPIGWHIPSDAEWKELEEYLGMSTDESVRMNWRGTDQGNKLKVYTAWKTPSDIYSVWGTNDYGFTAKGGGCCMYNGIWSNPLTFTSGFWWTSSTYNNLPLYRSLDYNKANIFRYYGPKTYGFSIRCVKD